MGERIRPSEGPVPGHVTNVSHRMLSVLLTQHEILCRTESDWSSCPGREGPKLTNQGSVFVWLLEYALVAHKLREYALVAHKLRLRVYRGESWPWKVVGPMGRALLSALDEHGVSGKLRQRVYRGESWPWKVVGPMGRALLSALDEHGVRPLPRFDCPADCTELRLANWTILPWGEDASKLFLSWPRATSAVWHKMRHECRKLSTHHGRASPSSLWWEAPRGSSDARAADQVIHQAPTHRIANGHADSPEERQASERRVVLLDRSPPRQLIIRGAVRWPLLRDQVSTKDTCRVLRSSGVCLHTRTSRRTAHSSTTAFL
jgi:hypothetical protein